MAEQSAVRSQSGPGSQGCGLRGAWGGPKRCVPPGWCYSARSASAGLSRAIARPGQNATALAMRITEGTMSRTGQAGVMAAAGMPRPWANSAQLHRPAAMPSGSPASRASPVSVLACRR